MIYVSLFLMAVIYAIGQKNSHTNGAPWFWLGWVSLALALSRPMHEASEHLFSVHMIQHTIITAVSAPLLILGRIGLTSLWALPSTWRRKVTRYRVAHTVQAVTRTPVGAAFAIHALTLWAWHLPKLYDAAVASDFVHALQHISFIATAMLFWQAVLAPRTRFAGLGKGVVFVFATAAHTAILGAFIALAPRQLYTAYALGDQQVAGMIMWVPAGLIYTVAGLALMSEWLKQAELRNATRKFATTTLVLLVAAYAAGCSDLTARRAEDENAAAMITGGNPRVGKTAVESLGCGGCHTISGARDAVGKVGPPLDGIASRMYIAGVLPNTPDNMEAWIVDPKAVDSLTAMPKLNITPAQARDIAAYLYTLR